MSKLIIHACSSLLVRPNGIVRYINAVIDLQRSQGHYVVFVTDAKPSETINASQIRYSTDQSMYKPNCKDGHVWLQYDNFIADQIEEAAAAYADADLVIAHDLHSYEALSRHYNDGIFVQHESDVLTAGSRYSYLDDEYISAQIAVVNSSRWRIGLTVNSTNIAPLRSVHTPCPMTLAAFPAAINRTKGLLYVGDASDRKGAKEFMTLARAIGVTPTVVSHEADDELFAGADVHSFTLTNKDRMFALMAQHRVAYIPSKNECPGLAALECAQFMPVVVDGQYEWTKYVTDLGVRVETNSNIKDVIQFYLGNPAAYTRQPLEIWAKNAQQLWTNLST